MAEKQMTKLVEITTSPERCFRAFTQEIDAWWPKHHSRSGDDATTIVLEPHDNGRLYERTPDGDEFVFGTVVEWSPGDRFALDWYLGTGQDNPSRVQIVFEPIASGTRVIITHDGADRVGEIWWSRVSVFDRAWSDVLAAYVQQAP